jgi:hypothetical protein
MNNFRRNKDISKRQWTRKGMRIIVANMSYGDSTPMTTKIGSKELVGIGLLKVPLVDLK